MIHPDQRPDGDLADEQVIEIAATPLRVLHTPGHSPGSVCLYAPALASCSPATPCSTAARAPPAGRTQTTTRSSRPSGTGCWTLPAETVVHTGHGEDTTIGAESGSISR